MNKYSISLLTFSIILFLSAAALVVAQEDPFSQISYPVAELGNCQNRDACEAYCEKEENMKACLDFAEAHNLMPKEEIEMARRMLASGETVGPGGCQSMVECEAYCNDINHLEECITFAEEHNMIPADELEEAKKVIAALKKGIKPPKCGGKSECDIYCSRPENMEECITFAEAAGLIPLDELEDAKKMLEAVRRGVKPPNCHGKEACDIYCSKIENMEECMEFGIAAGFIPPDEIEDARKMLDALKRGITPPNCQGEEECDVYCSKPENMKECMEFAVAAGFMPPEEIENVQRTLQAIEKGVMPPNCQGEEECDIYCSQEEHFEECVNFAEAAGFMTPEDAERARLTGGKGPGGCQTEEECQAFCGDPANMEECIDFAVKIGEMTPEEAEQAKTGMTGGPGGCQSEEECRAYCEDPANAEECLRAAEEMGESVPSGTEGTPPPEGEMPPPPEGYIPPQEQMQMPPPPGTETMPPPSEDEKIPPPGEIIPPPEKETEIKPEAFLRIAGRFLANVLLISFGL